LLLSDRGEEPEQGAGIPRGIRAQFAGVIRQASPQDLPFHQGVRGPAGVACADQLEQRTRQSRCAEEVHAEQPLPPLYSNAVSQQGMAE
jgi:hypothetical protein